MTVLSDSVARTDLVEVGPGSRPQRRRGPAVPRVLLRLAGPLVILLGWQVAEWLGWVDADLVPGPVEVTRTGWEMIERGDLGAGIWASLIRVLWGLAVGTVLAVIAAVLSGLTRIGDHVVDSAIQVLRAVPVIALTPLLIIWLGVGEEPKRVIVAIATFFPIYLNTHAGIRGVDHGLVEMWRVFGGGRARFLREIVLPGALPGFLVGLRYSLAVSWLVLVFAEQINTNDGLGALLNRSFTTYKPGETMAVIVVYGILGLASDGIVRLLERRLLAWRRGIQV
ncbi:ABC transporter permease [Frankia sp. QA3]|uniref:ABC transporter permease n=1 Tax=Frankia sp. QA3 TaxID=710111 RepID=UPI000269BDB1|nr:ABC transporter permease [Frankia sp. QA3]EIV91833.1 ABC-type nitrate/sulfonate/bicarbonate transport system, permease component [Frankia sp. QA3]